MSRIIFVGSLLLFTDTGVSFELKSPLKYLDFFKTSLSGTTYRHHAVCRSHSDDHQRVCSYGKCTLIEQFQQACPLAHSTALTPLSGSVLKTSYYTSDFLVNGSSPWLPSVDILSNSSVALESQLKTRFQLSTPLQGFSTCDKVINRCFNFKGVYQCTYYLQDDSCTVDLFHINKTVSAETFNENLKLRSLQFDFYCLKLNPFIAWLHHSFQVIKTRHLSAKYVHNRKHEYASYTHAANAALLLLLLLAGDVERNPGPGNEQLPPITIRELAIFPVLEDAWEDLGRALSIDDQTLRSINQKFPTAAKKQKEIFRVYLKMHPTWSDIINALVTIGRENIARQVLDTFELPQQLLSTRASNSLAANCVKLNTPLTSTRIIKSEMQSSKLDSGRPPQMPSIVSNDGPTSSANSTVTAKLASRVVSAKKSKTGIHSSKNVNYPHSDYGKRMSMPCIDGASLPTEMTNRQFQLEDHNSTPSALNERKIKTVQLPLGLDSINDSFEQEINVFTISGSAREYNSTKREDQRLSSSSPDQGLMSPCSDDFHSAEETPLDVSNEANTTTSIKAVGNSRIHPPDHDQIKDLYEAIMNRNIDRLNLCIGGNASLLNVTLQDGQTGLHIASKLGFKDVTKVLLQHKALVTMEDTRGCTPLYLAASNGNYEIVKLIIASPGCDVNTKSKNGTPLLLDPASKGFSMICELLLENGANPLTETITGVSPLYAASKNGHKDVVKILLKFGANVTKVCAETSKTPLQEAIDSEHVEVVKLLIRTLSEINKKNERLFECKTAEEVQDLVKHGANVDAQKANGSTSLIAHSAAGNKEVVQGLIEQRANVDIQDNDGWSALMVASQNGHIKIVQSLIYAGAIPDLKNKEGLTALMCATLTAHLNMIKELLLAKADPLLKRKNGKSALEIAEQYGNQEIIMALKRHTMATTSGNDPLYSLLGSYLELKNNNASEKQAAKTGEKASHMALTLKGKESLSSLLPKPPAATVDDTSTAKQELEKCYKRIADLETRIHDLTLQNSIEVPVETDLAYLERKRLEDEYCKLKELKRKAKQYAVEAKQTALRLSAENSKLREDLSKERRHNEITRNNIIREFEQKVSHETMAGEKLTTKMEVFDQEIQDRAYQLLRRMPQEKGIVKRVELTAMNIKEVVLEKRITVNCLKLAVMGLPLSGKSEFLHQMLELKYSKSLTTEGVSPNNIACVDSHEAILCQNQFNDSHTWIKSTNDGSSIHTISASLAQTLMLVHNTSSLSSCLSSLVNPGSIVEEFPDPLVNQYFKAVLENLQKLVVQLETSGSLDTLKIGSLAIFNLAKLNSGVSKVTFEIFCALANRCKNLLILNILNLERDTPDKFATIAENELFSKGEQKTTKLESSMQRYVQVARVASKYCEGRSVIMVGTHKDKLTRGKLKETKKHLEQIVMGYAETVGVADVICPGMECITTKDNDDRERLQNRIIELVSRRQDFQYSIPIKYIFLHSYLQSLKQMFISRQKLMEVAHACGLIDEDEIEEFLTIFNNCGSIIYSSNDEFPILKDYIILNPSDFINELDKLNFIDTMSFISKPELFEEVQATKLGFISEKMATCLWPKEGEGKMTQAHFLLSLLKELKVTLPSNDLQVKTSSGIIGGGKSYYMPLLRPDCDAAELTGDSSSLIIIHNNAILMFHLLADMILQLQSYFGTSITFAPSPNCNTIHFKWRDYSQEQHEADIIIRLLTEKVDISVKFLTQAPRMSTVTRIYSQLKMVCIQIFRRLSTQVKGLHYEFAFVCPRSNTNPTHKHAVERLPSTSTNKVHFVSFHPHSTGEQRFFCQTCQDLVPSDKLPWTRLLWTQVAYQELMRDTINHEGCLTPEQIATICQNLASTPCLDNLYHFAKQLQFSREEIIRKHSFMSLEGLLHYLIFTWRNRNPVNSVKSLAKILHSCGCYQEAVRLDPLLVNNDLGKAITDHESECNFSSTYYHEFLATHMEAQATFEQFTQALNLNTDQLTESLASGMKSDAELSGEGMMKNVITRDMMVRTLRELKYNSLAVAMETGTLKKLDPTPVIVELRNLHASLF